MDERMCRDAYNTINAAYLDIRSGDPDMTVEAAVACTLVCACTSGPNVNLLGNFERALSKGESLAVDQIRAIEQEFLMQIGSSDQP